MQNNTITQRYQVTVRVDTGDMLVSATVVVGFCSSLKHTMSVEDSGLL